MTGKAYYITTLADWQRHAARFANSHWLALDPCAPGTEEGGPSFVAPASPPASLCGATDNEIRRQDAGATNILVPEAAAESSQDCQASAPGAARCAPTGENPATPPANGDTKILVLVEADEGVHLSLEDDPAFEALPHPLAEKPISDVAQSALAPHGVPPGATTFDAAEAVARVHPLLRHRVF